MSVDAPTLSVEIVALAVAVYAAVRSLPRPLDLPWAILFDAALDTIVRGQADPRALALTRTTSVAAVLGPGVDWAAIAAWTPAVQDGLARRFRDTVVADIGSGWARTMSAVAPGIRGISVAPPRQVDDDEALAERLLDLVPRPSERLVLLLGTGESARVLRALAVAPALRDRVVAVVAVGELIRGEASPDWLDEHFDHESFDVELNRVTPWVSVVDAALAADRQHWPDPALPASGRQAIAALSLGPLPLTDLPREALCRALWVLLAFRLYD